mgnify:CR=1 FL=1
MTTNISDLPGGNSNQPNIQLHTKEKDAKKIPLNSINEMVSGLQKAAQKNMTRLPQRDVPMDPERYAMQEEIKPNYVPKPQHQNYIDEELDYMDMMERNQNEIINKSTMDNVYDQIQTPVVAGILFFLFQLPFMNKLLLKFVPSLFKEDGHPLFSGYLFKTFLFSLSLFLMHKGLDTLSSF